MARLSALGGREQEQRDLFATFNVIYAILATNEAENWRGVAFVSRGFRGRREKSADASRLPPGQYLVRGFPVLSAGPTPRTPLSEWSFTIDGMVGNARSWSAAALVAAGVARHLEL